MMYRIIRKSLRRFRPLRYSSRDGHAEGEHVNRGRETLPSFCPTLQVLDYVHPWWHSRCQSCNQVPATHVACLGMTAPATVPQGSEIPEGLMNYPV